MGPALIPFPVDRGPHERGLPPPGTHVPIRAPAAEAEPTSPFVLPRNPRDEIEDRTSRLRESGGRFVPPLPRAPTGIGGRGHRCVHAKPGR